MPADLKLKLTTRFSQEQAIDVTSVPQEAVFLSTCSVYIISSLTGNN